MRAADYFSTHPVFTHAEFVAAHTAMGRSRHKSNNLLARHLRSGRLWRIRRGLYASAPLGVEPRHATADPYLIASKLAGDAVIACHAALEFYGRAYSVWNRFHYLSSARAKPTRFGGMNFVQVQVPTGLRSLPDLGGEVLETRYCGETVRVTT